MGWFRRAFAVEGAAREGIFMTKKTLAKGLALIGTVLVWLPVLAPFFFGLAGLLADGVFNFDYLMPAELGLMAITGAVLLIAAAILAHSRLKLIGGSIGAAIAAIVIGQFIASVTGLASGEIEPTGWQWALVTACLAIYVLALAATGAGGALLTRDLFVKQA
jgi:hypothetical protein